MATPPTFQAEYEAAWDTTTTPKTVTPTTAAGDILAVFGGVEDFDLATLNTPTGNSLTYTQQQAVAVSGNWCAAHIWTAPDATGGAGWTLSDTRTAGVAVWGFNCLRFSGSDGVGASAKANTTGAPSLNITTQADNSAIVVGVFDWNAVDGASRTWRTVNGITPAAGDGEKTYFTNGVNYTVYGAYYSDAGAAGVKTVGLSAPTGQEYSIVAVEIKGTAGGAAAAPAVGIRVRRGPAPRRGPLGRMDLLRAYHHRHRSTEIISAAALTVDQTDDAGLTDSVAFVQQLERTDSAGLTDNTVFTEALEHTDSAGLTDTSTVELVKLITQTDSAGLTDSVLFTEALERTDSAGLTDSASIQQELVRTDSAGLTDSNVRELVKLVTADDPAGLTDTTAFAEQLVRTDSAGLTDTTALTEQLVRTDSAGLTDTSVVGLLKDVTQTDSVGLTDTRLFIQALVRTDDSGLTDSVDIGGTAGTAIIPKAALIEPGTRAYAAIEPGIRVGVNAEPGTRGAAALAGASKTSANVEPGTRSGPNIEGGV